MAAKKKKKSLIKKHRTNFAIFIFGVLVASLGFYLFSSNNNSSTVVEAGRRIAPAAWNPDTCFPDPASTDRTPPTVTILEPVDGGKVPVDSGSKISSIKFKIIASDNNLLYTGGYAEPRGFRGGESGQTRAWLIRDGVIHDVYYNTPDLTGQMYSGILMNDIPFYMSDGVGYNGPGQTIKFQIGICDFAGNKAYSNTITVTTAK